MCKHAAESWTVVADGIFELMHMVVVAKVCLRMGMCAYDPCVRIPYVNI